MNQTELIIVNSKKKTFKNAVSAVDELVDLAAPTYGPANNKVIIDKRMYKMVLDDGVQTARDFSSSDPVKNAIVHVLKEVAVKTSDRSKDGTTGSLIMVRAILKELDKRKFSGHKVELELKKGLEEVKKYIEINAIKIEQPESIKKVAMISYNNEEIADMIVEIFSKVGKNGDVDVIPSSTLKTTFEIDDGIKIKNGYISPYMVNNQDKMACVVDKPHFLITDYRLTETSDILTLMNKMKAIGKTNLVVIADNVESKALSTMIINQPHVMNQQTKQFGTFLSCAVVAPQGKDRLTTLNDIALMTGGKVFCASKGEKLENVNVEDLGTAEKFIANDEESTIIDPKGDKAEIGTAITTLRNSIDKEEDESKKKKLEKRLSLFTNSVATIKVGAPTDNERKAKIKKVENSTQSVKSALNGGVIAGGGFELYKINTSSDILNRALKHPLKQIRKNMSPIGLNGWVNLVKASMNDREAYNFITGERGHFLNVGVCDPAQTIISGVENAVSIACLLATSSGIIKEVEKTDQ